jgi:hypothetical protein
LTDVSKRVWLGRAVISVNPIGGLLLKPSHNL